MTLYYDMSFRTAGTDDDALLVRYFRLLTEHAEEILQTPEMAECAVPAEICHGPCYGRLDLASLLQRWLTPDSPWVVHEGGKTYYLMRAAFGVGGYCYGCHAIDAENGTVVRHLRPRSWGLLTMKPTIKRVPRRRFDNAAPLQGIHKEKSSFVEWERDTQSRESLLTYQLDDSRVVEPPTLDLAEVAAHCLPERPLIVNIPHASAEVPPSVRFPLSGESLCQALSCAAEKHTEKLLPLLPNILHVVAPYSRLVADVSRSEEEAAASSPLRGIRSAALQTELLRAYYMPHHAKLSLHTRLSLQHHGCARMLELHSYPAGDTAAGEACPDIRILTARRDPTLMTALAECCRRHGLRGTVTEGGAPVPKGYEADPRVQSVRLAIRRDLFMDSRRSELHSGAASVRRFVRAAAELLRQS